MTTPHACEADLDRRGLFSKRWHIRRAAVATALKVRTAMTSCSRSARFRSAEHSSKQHAATPVAAAIDGGGCGREVLRAVLLDLREQARVQHRRVSGCGAVLPAQHAEGEF